jgi:hypothetical protein
MNLAATPTAWPVQVALDCISDRHVSADDGRAFELQSFRDACHVRAADLRQDAIDAGAAAALHAMRRWLHGAEQWVRAAAAVSFHLSRGSST